MTNENDKPRLTPKDQAFLEEVVKPLGDTKIPDQEIIFLGGGQTPIIPIPELTEEAKRGLEEKKRNICQHRS